MSKLIFKSSEELNAELGRSGDVENIGTLESLMPKGTRVKFGKNNFNSDKLVVVCAISKDGKLAFISCSKPISRLVRELFKAGKTKTEILGWLITLDVVENEKGMFISKPMGEAGESIEIGKLTKVATEDFVPEELIAF
jgi:hypothetical protein